jgi:uncharacterized protein involved in exopolysaccharide biosynthesis
VDMNSVTSATKTQPGSSGSGSGSSVLYWIREASRWRRMVLLTALLFALVAVVIGLLTPDKYRARATILLEVNDSPVNLNMLGSIGSLAGLGQSASSGDVYLAILRSRRVMDAVIDSLDLSTHYSIDGGSPEEIREKTISTLSEKVRFRDPDTVTLTIRTEDTDPDMAAVITNVFLDRLLIANQTLTLSRSQRTRLMIEEALIETETEIENVRLRLVEFQTHHGVFALDEQTKGTLLLIGQLQGKLLEAQTRRDALGGVMRKNSAEVRTLDLNISALESQIDRLVGNREGSEESSTSAPGADGNGAAPNFILPLSEVPDLTGDYARIMMDLTILETKYSILATQLETTKIEESQSIPSFEILDYAQRPHSKYSPQRIVLVLSALAIGLLIGILVAILISYYERHVSPQTQNELAALLPNFLARRLATEPHGSKE